MINLIKGDCLEKMKEIESGSIDMVLTSPPYDNLRDYGKDFTGWGDHIWKPCLDQIYRTLKNGGVCVWIVADATIKGSETGTSFKQALYAKEIGFNLHDTMIYQKNSYMPLTHNRYEQAFEYMFVFSKGRPVTWNAIKVPCKTAGSKRTRKGSKAKELTYSERKRDEITTVKSDKQASNIFTYDVGKNEKSKHNAPFPLQLAIDHIISWSNEGDVILDPFMGSGTTGFACKNLNRSFIGIEMDDEYFEIAKERIENTEPNLFSN